MERAIAFIEPILDSVAHLRVAKSRGLKCVVVTGSKNNASRFSYSDFNYTELASEVIVADIQSNESILKALKSSKYSNNIVALIPGNEHTLVQAAEVAKIIGVRGMDSNACKRVVSKELARESFKNAGLEGPLFDSASNFETAKEAALKIGLPVIVKPVDGVAGNNVYLVHTEVELTSALNSIFSADFALMQFKSQKKVLIEEYLEGPEFSVELVLKDGKAIFSEVTEKQNGAPLHFVSTLQVVPTSVNLDQKEDIAEVARLGLIAVGFSDFVAHIEVKLSKRGPIIIEINPRPGGSMISSDLMPLAFGVNFYETLFDYYVNGKLDIKKTKNLGAAAAFFLAEREGKIKSFRGQESLDKNPNIKKWHLRKKIGDVVRPPIEATDRLGYLITAAETSERAKAIALEAVKYLKVEYES